MARRFTAARVARVARPMLLTGLSIVAALALCLAFVQATLAAPAAPWHATETAISGVVVDGTRGGAPVPNLPVTLQATDGGGTRDVATATTDAGGRFAFDNLANADASVFAVYARFQQGFYSSGGITVDNGTQGVTLTVYDATSDPGALRITSVTALVRDPRPRNGLVRVGEYFTFHNGGNTAFVGTAAASGGQPMGLVRFALPAGASDLTLGAGFAGAQTAQVPAGFGATATVPPGDSQFAFAFDAPYSGTTCSLTFKVEYPADHLLALVSPPAQLETHDLTSRGSITSSGEPYAAYTRDGLDAGTTLSARVVGLPVAGEARSFDFAELVALAAALTLLLLAALALYLRRGELAGALRLVPVPAHRDDRDAASLAALSSEDREAERERLLRRLAALERSPGGGHGGPRARQEAKREIGELRGRLRTLLAALPEEDLRRLTAREGVDGAGESPTAAAESGAAPAGSATSEATRPAPAEASRLLSGGAR